MYNYQKIAKAVIKNFSEGEDVSCREIINVVLSEFPEIKKGSIIPSDYCSNYSNKDPHSGVYHIFRKVLAGRGRYIVLPHDEIKKSCKLNNL